MDLNFLSFEQPIAELESKIKELQLVGNDNELNIASLYFQCNVAGGSPHRDHSLIPDLRPAKLVRSF